MNKRKKYDVVNFETNIPPARIKNRDLENAEAIVSNDDLTYDSISHYIRCAIIKLNREEKRRLRI